MTLTHTSRIVEFFRNLPKVYGDLKSKPRVCNYLFQKSTSTVQMRFAGHSKWSKIKRSKGAKDVNRAKIFSKATRAIRVASRGCGGDMANLHLQSAVQAAKALQVPKDRIADAINCASKDSGEDLVKMRYDGYINTSSGRVALILTALTDNKNRTAGNVRSKISKSDGELASSGTNDWLFDHLGVALVHKQKGNTDLEDSDQLPQSKSYEMSEEEEDNLLECALENGAVDVDFGEMEDEHAMVTCEPTDLHAVVMGLRKNNYNMSEFESRYLLKNDTSFVKLDEESTEKFQKFLDKMDDDDDVDHIFHNGFLRNETKS